MIVIEEFLRDRYEFVVAENSDHFKKLARSLLSDFVARYGRRMTGEEWKTLARFLATEALSLGAFTHGKIGGGLEAALEYVREEFLRGRDLAAGASGADAQAALPRISDAVTQD